MIQMREGVMVVCSDGNISGPVTRTDPALYSRHDTYPWTIKGFEWQGVWRNDGRQDEDRETRYDVVKIVGDDF